MMIDMAQEENLTNQKLALGSQQFPDVTMDTIRHVDVSSPHQL